MYRETFRSAHVLPREALAGRYDGPRVALTDIYYLLHGTLFSGFHQLRSDEIWHYHAGGTLLAHEIRPDGTYTRHALGFDAGEALRVTFPAGSWFAAELQHKAATDYALVSCVVAPGFEFSDFTLGQRAALLKTFPQHSTVITRLTRG